jgi:iron complex transport system substrate-binding protein
MRRILSLLLAGSLGLSCLPENPGDPKAGNTTYTDDTYGDVSLPQAPGRVVSLAPNITEMIYALGAGDRVVGVTAWCNFPPQAKSKQVVGDATSLNLERLLSLRPDLAVMVGNSRTPLLAKLESVKVPVLVLSPVSIDDIFRDIRLLSAVLGARPQADSLLGAMESRLRATQALVEKIPQSRRPRVFAEISSQPLMTAGPNSLVGQIIEWAGGGNIMSDLAQDYAVVNPELVVARRPEVILILEPGMSKQAVLGRLGWENVPAVSASRIYDDLDLDVVLRAGPRIADGLEQVYRRLHER